jgi:electron transfer flavoprotein alpha subunit
VIAVIPVRAGVLPAGADATVAEARGVALVVGDGAEAGAGAIRTATGDVLWAELGSYRPAAWAATLAPSLTPHDVVLLPASPDGRDLAPRLAHVLDRPLLAGAMRVTPTAATLTRWGRRVAAEHEIRGPVVATFAPDARGVDPAVDESAVHPVRARIGGIVATEEPDAEVLGVLPADPATIDLSEADRIVAGGAGLGGPGPFALLQKVALAVGASYGATRVAADLGWVPQDRFIGTTGVAVSPSLYVALGISGAVQHVTGLGDPLHMVAINLDASAPMMELADLAVVTDGRAFLAALADRLGVGDG